MYYGCNNYVFGVVNMEKEKLITQLLEKGYSAEFIRDIVDLIPKPKQWRPTQRRVPCEIYSRIVGYFRPVNQWNKGKQEEFKERAEIHLSRLNYQ